MWPKALAQLIELAPHITRLVPAADRFLNSKAASEEAARNTLQQMAEGMRGDLGQVTAAHSGLYQELKVHTQLLEAHSDTLAAMKTETRSLRAGVDGLQKKVAGMRTLLAINSVALGIVIALIVVLLVRR
jgi:hypothetical protein